MNSLINIFLSLFLVNFFSLHCIDAVNMYISPMWDYYCHSILFYYNLSVVVLFVFAVLIIYIFIYSSMYFETLLTLLTSNPRISVGTLSQKGAWCMSVCEWFHRSAAFEK